MTMFDILKKRLYFTKTKILFDKGLKSGKISRFADEIFERMSSTIIACLPVSLYMKYSNYLFSEGTCYERSLYMFLALDDAILVRGNNVDLEYNYGKNHGYHGWVEVGNIVYDPSLMLKFDKDTYYSLYGCRNITKIDKKTYLSEHHDFVDRHVSYDYNEFKPNGKRRLELGLRIILLKELSQLANDKQFTKDLNDYLDFIEYEEKQIYQERQALTRKRFDV